MRPVTFNSYTAVHGRLHHTCASFWKHHTCASFRKGMVGMEQKRTFHWLTVLTASFNALQLWGNPKLRIEQSKQRLSSAQLTCSRLPGIHSSQGTCFCRWMCYRWEQVSLVSSQASFPGSSMPASFLQLIVFTSRYTSTFTGILFLATEIFPFLVQEC